MKLKVISEYRSRNLFYKAGSVIEIDSVEKAKHLMVDAPGCFEEYKPEKQAIPEEKLANYGEQQEIEPEPEPEPEIEELVEEEEEKEDKLASEKIEEEKPKSKSKSKKGKSDEDQDEKKS